MRKTNDMKNSLVLSLVLGLVFLTSNSIAQVQNQDRVIQTRQAQQAQQQGPTVYGGASTPDAQFRTAIQNVINNYRNRGVSFNLLNNVENAVRSGNNNNAFAPQVRIRNIDPSGTVSVFYDRWGSPAMTIGPGQMSAVINVNQTVYLRAYKIDQWGNSKVTNINIEQIGGNSARFWDGDDFQTFTLQQGNLFPRGLNHQANLNRYRLER